MSTTFNQYLILGVKLPYQKFELTEPFHDNGYSEEIKYHEGLTAVSDGMNGKYTFIGRIIKKARVGEVLDETFNLTDLVKAQMNPGVVGLLSALLHKTFPDLGIEPADIGLWFVTHWH